MEQQVERLDAVSKALLACHAITHMLTSCQSIMINHVWLEHVKSKDPDANEGINSVLSKSLKEGIERQQKFLDDTVENLAAVAEEVFNFMNDSEMVSEIDIRIIRPYTQIIGDGLDEVDNPYDEPVPNPAPPFA